MYRDYLPGLIIGAFLAFFGRLRALHDHAHGGALRSSCAAATRPARRAQLLLLADCSKGPVEGFRAPLWRYYPPHRAALLASRPPLRGKLVVGTLRADGGIGPFATCIGPAAEGLPLEAAWDAKADAELRAEAGGAISGGGGADDAVGDPCSFAWELVLDGQGPPRRLLAALSRGAVVVKQESPYVEFFSARLEPWKHYVPVSDNLADLAARVAWLEANPESAAAISAAGQALASQLHLHELSCFWWQLLTALAPLEDFKTRAEGFITQPPPRS